ncbi:MAG: Mpo1-like protein [Gammaproteobacteria bacterium]|nr:Mpo1-like protein [Gammaproteobacteria bacterium]
MRTISEWLDEYGESHRHPVNKLVHWICVPLIVFSLLGLIWSLPLPEYRAGVITLNLCVLFMLASLVYYLVLSWRLAIGMLVCVTLVYFLLFWLDSNVNRPWLIYIAVFVVAWIGQFAGHEIEGKRPAFFRDIQFLLIGPLWLLSAVYRKLNLQY